MKTTSSDLKLTGERTLPGFKCENYWFKRHVAAYLYAAELSAGLATADIGCGEGYGTAMLAEKAKQVVGVDAAPEVVEHAQRKYGKHNLNFEVADAGSLGLPSGHFDLVVSLQVIEHLLTIEGFITEIERVLKPGGTAVITTPNRLKISPGSETPVNPFHLREFTPDELGDLLYDRFSSVRVMGLFHAGLLRINDQLKIVDFIDYYQMGKFNPRYWTHRLITPLVSERHFKITGGRLDECQDIIAVCEKKGR